MREQILLEHYQTRHWIVMAMMRFLVRMLVISQPHNDINLSSIIQREIANYLKDKGSSTQALFAQTNFAGIPLNPVLSCNLHFSSIQLEKGSWIIDIGASNHMCHDLNKFDEITNMYKPATTSFSSRWKHSFGPQNWPSDSLQRHISYQCSLPT